MVVIEVPDSDPWHIYPIGDAHLGASVCDEKRLQAYCQQIADDPRGRWIGMGDYFDAIGLRDPRFEAGGLAPWLYDPLSMQDIIGTQQRRFIDRYAAPIADKCLAMLIGNHEEKVSKWLERDIGRELNRAMKECRSDKADLVLGYAGWVTTSFRAPPRPNGTKPQTWSTLKIWAHHGAGGAATPAGRMNRLIKFMNEKQADLVLMGHVHGMESHIRPIERTDDRGKERERDQLGMITGTFLKQAAYAVQKGYATSRIGAPYVTYWPRTGELEPRFPPALTGWRQHE